MIEKTESLPDLIANLSRNAMFSTYQSRRKNLTESVRFRCCSEGDVDIIQDMDIDCSSWSERDFVHVC